MLLCCFSLLLLLLFFVAFVLIDVVVGVLVVVLNKYKYISNSLYCSLNSSRVNELLFGGKVENIHILWLFIHAY